MPSEIEIQIESDGRLSTSADDFLRFAEMAARRSGRLGPPDPDADTYSPAQVAVKLACSRSTVDKMAADGTLPGVIPLRRGKRKQLYSVNRRIFDRWLEGRGKK